MKIFCSILTLLLLSFQTFSQNGCLKAEKQLNKHIQSGTYKTTLLEKAYKNCPDNAEVNKLLGSKFILHTSDLKRQKGFELLMFYNSIDENDYEVNKLIGLTFLSRGNLDEAKASFLKARKIITLPDASDSLKILKYRISHLINFTDTIQYLEDADKNNFLKKYEAFYKLESKVEKLYSFENDKQLTTYFESLNITEKQHILKYLLGLVNVENPFNPYFYFDKAEKAFNSVAIRHKSGKPYIPAASLQNFARAKSNYKKVLGIVPNHQNSLIRLADINYFNRNFDKAKDYYLAILNNLNQKQKATKVGVEAYRMIRRIDWLKTIDKGTNFVKKDRLYYDKGRNDESLLAVGNLFGESGNIASQATGNLNYAIAGTALNFGVQLINNARLKTNWFKPLYQKGKWQKLNAKCNSQIVLQINNTGFYSPSTILLVCGITQSSQNTNKPYNEAKLAYYTLVDLVNISGVQEKFYLQSAMDASLLILSNDEDLQPVEIYRVVQSLLKFEDIYKRNFNANYLSEAILDAIEIRKNYIIEKIKKAN